MSNQKQNKETVRKEVDKLMRYGKFHKTSKTSAKQHSAKSKKQNSIQYRKKQPKAADKFTSPVKIAFLGGLNEV